MGSSHRHPPPLVSLLPLLLIARYASAQPAPNNNSPNFAKNFNPSMAIVIVVLISAFFFLGFFSVYMRQCAGERREISARATTTTGRSRRQRGLDPDLLATFPTLVYSDVKAHKIGKGSLECAVCLSEFEDDETLRLLPQCSHVFHPDCIDAWLSAHVTCPVCRTNLSNPVPPSTDAADPQPIQEPSQEPPPVPDTAAAAVQEDHVAIEIDANHQLEEERKAEIDDLEKFVNMKRARSRARPARFPRSHSTGHSLVLPGENLDRFTLRLPENIRREIVSQAERFQIPSEGSSNRGYGGGEGSSRGTRSVRLGRSDRWGSSLLRTLSMKVPNWGRRGGEEGSMSGMGGGGGLFRRGDSIKGAGGGGGVFKRGNSMKGEGSMRRFNAVVAPFDCYGGGAAKIVGSDVKDDDSQSSTAALNRV